MRLCLPPLTGAAERKVGHTGRSHILLTEGLFCSRKDYVRKLPVIKRLGLVTREASSSHDFSGPGSNAVFL